MRKSTLFISVVLTTFMLALLFGVASAYRGIVNATNVSTTQVQSVAPVVTPETISQSVPALPTQPVIVSPDQAASLAAQSLGHTDVYSVESTQYQGAAAYLVTFTSGDLVYVSPTGQILNATKLKPVVVTVPKKNHSNNSGNNGGGSSSSGNSHEDGGGQEHDD